MCKALHVLPRSGGLLDQPADEILRLEKIIDAYARYDDYLNDKSSTRDRNRKRFSAEGA